MPVQWCTLPKAVNAAQTKAPKPKLEGQKRIETDGHDSGLQVAMQQSLAVAVVVSGTGFTCTRQASIRRRLRRRRRR